MPDPLREDVGEMLTGLRGQGVASILLATGDRVAVARQEAEGLGLDGIRADLTPEGKVLLVLSERKNEPVMMVGDGVNDAPAVSAADVGVVMGAGCRCLGRSRRRGTSGRPGGPDRAGYRDRAARPAYRAAKRRGRDRPVRAGHDRGGVGYLTPVQGALTQEVIDVAVILNALRSLRIQPRGIARMSSPADRGREKTARRVQPGFGRG